MDFYVQFAESADDPEKPWFYKGGNIDDVYAQQNESIYDEFGEYLHFHDYIDDDFTFYDYLGDKRDEFLENNNEIYSRFNFTETIIKLSDYNALMKLYGKEQIELAIPAAIPTLELVRIDGKVTGSSEGSFIVLS